MQAHPCTNIIIVIRQIQISIVYVIDEYVNHFHMLVTHSLIPGLHGLMTHIEYLTVIEEEASSSLSITNMVDTPSVTSRSMAKEHIIFLPQCLTEHRIGFPSESSISTPQ